MLLAFIEDIGDELSSLNYLKGSPVELKQKFHEIIQFHSTILQLSRTKNYFFQSNCIKMSFFCSRFAYDFSYIYEIIIVGYYLWSVSTICSTLLVIRIEMVKSILFIIHSCMIYNIYRYYRTILTLLIQLHNNGRPVDIILASIIMFWAFCQFFLFCNFGQYVTNEFSEIDNLIYFCDWYTFPKEIQRILPTVIATAQQPVILEGFANLTCTREAFKKVNQLQF